MKFNGVPIKCGDLHFWTMVDRNIGKPRTLKKFVNAFPTANILQITQYAVDSYLYTTIWFVDESKVAKKS